MDEVLMRIKGIPKGRSVLSLLFFAAVMTQPAQGADYYVDNGNPGASDAGPGTEAQPWVHCPGMNGWSGSAELQPGDTVYFSSSGTWSASGGQSVLEAAGGVIYDGSTWGAGARATLRAEGELSRAVINIMSDHPEIATMVRGFEADAGGTVTSGITINWPQSEGSLVGATKRIENCVVHDVDSRSAEGQYEYGIVVSSGYGGNRTVSNVEIVDCTVYNISRGGINVYCANDDPLSRITDVLVRGCEIYSTGLDPDYAGSALPMKNHVINVVFEYNYVHDATRGMGIGVSSHDENFRGPENAVIRHNIVRGSELMGINLNVKGSLSLDIYGNIIAENTYQGIRFMDVRDTLALRIYNNTLVHNYHPDWSHEILVHTGDADVSLLEIKNNLFVALPETLPLQDEDGSITDHSNNFYYRQGDDALVRAGGTIYTTGDITSWEPTALAGDPLLGDISSLPTGFTGTFGVDMRPNTDGLLIRSDSPAKDSGADLGDTYSTSINSVTRPAEAGWDRGAYEFSTAPPPDEGVDHLEPGPDPAADGMTDIAGDEGMDAAADPGVDDNGESGCGCTLIR